MLNIEDLTWEENKDRKTIGCISLVQLITDHSKLEEILGHKQHLSNCPALLAVACGKLSPIPVYCIAVVTAVTALLPVPVESFSHSKPSFRPLLPF
ncbi:hypothetical protein VN97_g780 [Penicillium thymicola]|uniref:Uncharacterized protein n=1 Tax=Penicillium thymicola TaxID=293382 RepID=A0AAI9XDY1_PENTH|nr:hypothetical protein VN97_g780 [Penicillium thymicola]